MVSHSLRFVLLQLLRKNIYVETGIQYSLPYFQSRKTLQLMGNQDLYQAIVCNHCSLGYFFSENCVGCALFENSMKKKQLKLLLFKDVSFQRNETQNGRNIINAVSKLKLYHALQGSRWNTTYTSDILELSYGALPLFE